MKVKHPGAIMKDCGHIWVPLFTIAYSGSLHPENLRMKEIKVKARYQVLEKLRS